MRWIVICIMLLPLRAQEKQDSRKTEGAKPPTNLKILKVQTGAEVNQIMRTFTAGLGVQCTYCHAMGDFASDANPKKEMARRMIQITQELNTKFQDGKLRVSCYTCHRGEAEPKTAPEPRGGQ
jgi:hypothetical protein